MQTTNRYVVVLVTAPNLRVARRLASAALDARLCACVNIARGLESHYWWQEKKERAREVLLLVKTQRHQLRALESLILDQHPYDTAEFVVLPIVGGSAKYLAWIEESVRRRINS